MDNLMNDNQVDILNESPRRQQDNPVQAEAALETSQRASTGRASNGFQDIPVGQKLALIALALLIPIAILTYFVISRDNSDINFSAKERQGVEYLIPLRTMLEHVLEARTLGAMWLSGVDVEEAWREEADEISEAITEIQAIDIKYGASFNTSSQTQQLFDSWQALTSDVETKAISVSESGQRHDQFLQNELIALITEVGNQSNLILDPDLDSFYAMNLTVVQLPALLKNMGDMMQVAVEAALKGETSNEELSRLGALTALVQNGFDNSAQSKRFIVQTNPTYVPQIQPLIDGGSKTKEDFLTTINQIIANPVIPADEEPVEFFENIMSKLDPEFESYDRSVEILDELLQARIAAKQRISLFTLLGTAASLLLAIALVAFITRQITRPLRELSIVSERVGQGDLSQLAGIESRDEIGNLAKSLNNSIVQLREANTRQDVELQRSKQLQQNIGEFLNVAMDIAQGDFTRRGQVSEDALGNVVDAINFMTEELGGVLKDVQTASESVSQGATDMFGTADSIARAAEIQTQEAQKARNEVEAVTSSIRQMATTAGSSAQAAERALVASQEGRVAVTATLAEMQNIRREVQTVAKRVKGLNDRSLEISEIVETISKIAKQTNLLALNAALEASSAGDAGARFATVAGEVRALAENTTASVQRVSSLIKSVQDEVQEVLVGVETGNRQVEGGYKVAQQAGERLEEIATIAEQTAQFAQEISLVTREQVNRVEQVGQVVEGMAEISEQSHETVSQGREAAERLQALASELSTSIARFRIA